MQLTHPPKTPLILPPSGWTLQRQRLPGALGGPKGRTPPHIHGFLLLPQPPVCPRVSVATIRL